MSYTWNVPAGARCLVSYIQSSFSGRRRLVSGIVVSEMQVHRDEVETPGRTSSSVLDEQPCGEKRKGKTPLGRRMRCTRED